MALDDKAVNLRDLKVSHDDLDGKVANLKSDLNDVNSDIYYSSDLPITPYTSASGWRLTNAGLCTRDSSYQLVKYAVTSGTRLKVVSDDMFQFQTAASVPSSGTNATLVGSTYGEGVFYVVVPDTAAYLITSTSLENSLFIVSGYGNKITDANYALSTGELIYSGYVWESGRINNGANQANSNFRRVNGYYSTEDIDFIKSNESDVTIAFHYYDSSFTWVRGVSVPNGTIHTVDKTEPYYRMSCSVNDQSRLPDTGEIIGYKNTKIGKITDIEKELVILNSTATTGQYQYSASDYSRKRVNIVDGEPRIYSASYRVSINDYLSLPYDSKIINTNTEEFEVYGYYNDGDQWRYFSSNNTGGIPVINAGRSFIYTIRRQTEDTSESADINEFSSIVYLLAQTGIEVDNLGNEIEKLNKPSTDILKSNDDAVNKIWASRWLRSATATPLTLLWFSDIHRWVTTLKRIIEVKNYLNGLGILDGSIVTGDLVRNSTDEATAFKEFWNDTDGTADIMIALGNHDHYDVGSQPHGKASFAKMDAMFFQTVSDWGVVRESNYPFYYKDYASQKIRLIVADPAVTSDEADETTWLTQTLNGAKTLGYSVIVACHFLRTSSATIYDNNWSNNLARETGTDSMTYDWSGCDIISCVTDFISNGGKFICYMIGHTHTDIVSYVTGHQDQLIINVASASDDRGHETPLTTNDLPRYDDSRTQDCFNVLTVDAENSIIKCVRVGANVNMYQQPRTAFAYNYLTHTFISVI